MKKVVEGSRAQGPVDWMAHCDEHGLGICIIAEGKNDKLAAGLYQSLAQLTAVYHRPLFGVATTYRECIFTRLTPSPGANHEAVRLPTVLAPDGNVGAVKQVAQRLAGILDSQRQLVVDAASCPPSKRDLRGQIAAWYWLERQMDFLVCG